MFLTINFSNSMVKRGSYDRGVRLLPRIAAAASTFYAKGVKRARAMKKPTKSVIKGRLRSKYKYKNKSSKKSEPSEDLQKGISSFNRRILVNKPHKVGAVKGSTMRYSDVIGGTIVGSEGLQTVTAISYVGSVSQTMVPTNNAGTFSGLGYGLGQLGAPTATTNPVFITMNPNEANTGSAFIGSVVEPASDSIYLKNCVAKFDITNFSSVDTVVDIYVLRNKQHIPALKSPVDIWNSSLANERLGFTDQVKFTFGGAAATVGQMASFHPDARPTTNRAFNSFYKVLCCHRLKLSGGSCELLSFNLGMNMLIDVNKLITLQAKSGIWTNSAATWTSSGQDIDGLKGGVSFMVVQRGTPVDDSIVTGVSLGANKIGINIIRKFELKYVKGNAARLSTELAYDSLVTNSIIANQKIVNYSDVVAAIVQA